jgi:hypothetical protein
MNRIRAIIRWLDDYTLWAFNPDVPGSRLFR